MLNDRLIDHFQNPRNVGQLEPPAERIAVENPVCGDELKLWVRLSGERVTDVRYRVRGCTASIAAGSVLTELLLSLPIREISAASVERALGGLPAESKHAAVLCADAVRQLARILPPTG